MRTLIEKIHDSIEYINTEIDYIDTVIAYDYEQKSEASLDAYSRRRKLYEGEKRGYTEVLKMLQEELEREQEKIKKALE
jgi:hypothetical protein